MHLKSLVMGVAAVVAVSTFGVGCDNKAEESAKRAEAAADRASAAAARVEAAAQRAQDAADRCDRAHAHGLRK